VTVQGSVLDVVELVGLKDIAAYNGSDPHSSTVRRLRPRMASSQFVIYEVRGAPSWADAIERVTAADAAAAAAEAEAQPS